MLARRSLVFIAWSLFTASAGVWFAFEANQKATAQDDNLQAPPSPTQTDPAELTLKRLFKTSDFASRLRTLKWGDQNEFLWELKRGKEGPALQRFSIPALEATTIVPRERFLLPATESTDPDTEQRSEPQPIDIAEWTFSADEKRLLVYNNTRRVWRQHTRGDYWLTDLTKEEVVWRQVGGEAEEASTMFATFAPDGQSIAFVRDNDLYLEDCSTGDLQMVAGSDDPRLIHGTFDWVYEEELGLRNGFRFSPNSQKLAFWQLDSTGVPVQTMIDNTSQRYAQTIEFAYPKVGQTNSAAKVGVWDRNSKHTVWLDLPGDPREHYVAAVDWLPEEFANANGRLLVQQLNRKQNHNRVFLCDVETGHCVNIHTEVNDAWVRHQPKLHWIPASALGESTSNPAPRLLWLSERSGWRHIEAIEIPTPESFDEESSLPSRITPLTGGDWDVLSIEAVADDGRRIDFVASPEHAAQRALYRVTLGDGGTTKIQTTPQRVSPDDGGTFTYSISPNARHALETWSDFNSAPVKRLVQLDSYQQLKIVSDNETLQQSLDELTPVHTEFLRLPIGEFTDDTASEQMELDVWIMMPVANASSGNDAPRESIPLLVHVYGEPAGQTVLDRYGGTSYLWHRMLTQHGIAVASVDNRGANSPRGKAFRQSIYKQIGRISISDQAHATQALLKRFPVLDPNRVGLWGWSGGGSSTLNGLFQFPELYSMGIAIAPVPDQLDYDTIYQERYMGLVTENREAFVAGSPITHAGGLSDPLLLVHGTADDNVHYASSERLINRLIAENKQFRLMAYPGRTHSIKEGEGTRYHLRTMMTEFVLEKLKGGR
ncbi:S9 family peptidase [Rhodopirellula sp. JC740]|uniref:S9 family peptidase n=1 Tax=Rhodopirellula halodulae TaxID=2894198 RepID=A0ABS8NHR8_9BACT|nr:S9 family peptidase [Rhodopirellula sp. JC740]MCC9643107.1 S9 family peptidase [Rhodopirellula sp. JC740]